MFQCRAMECWEHDMAVGVSWSCLGNGLVDVLSCLGEGLVI